jgi:hypothetical protein
MIATPSHHRGVAAGLADLITGDNSAMIAGPVVIRGTGSRAIMQLNVDNQRIGNAILSDSGPWRIIPFERLPELPNHHHSLSRPPCQKRACSCCPMRVSTLP